MPADIMQFKLKGMSRDLSKSNFNPQFAFENYNIRFNATEDKTLMGAFNERGTDKALDQNDEQITFKGTVIGNAVVGDKLVVFSTIYNGIEKNYERTNEVPDYIYVVVHNEEENNPKGYWSIDREFKGYFNFSSLNPLETIPYIEKEDVQKVYWIDGRNQPRCINICRGYELSSFDYPKESGDIIIDSAFDFVPKMKLNENVSVVRDDTASGLFHSGVIQYVFTYFNIYGQESNIFHVSSMNYISFQDRGASPEETVMTGFKIKIDNLDHNFDYVRVYSILRTSLDTVAEARRVIDINIKEQDSIEFIDTHTTGDTIDPSDILYLGGKVIIPKTMSHKDGTLFFGNYKESNAKIKDRYKDWLDWLYSENEYRTVDTNRPSYILEEEVSIPNDSKLKEDINYEINLKHNHEYISTFKYGQTYRLGLQFQTIQGEWSEPYWLEDKTLETPIKHDDLAVKINKFLININFARLKEDDEEENYVNVRPLIVYPELNDKDVLYQGVLNPTVFNVQDRYNDYPFSQASWFFRPYGFNKRKNGFKTVQDINEQIELSLKTEDWKFPSSMNVQDPNETITYTVIIPEHDVVINNQIEDYVIELKDDRDYKILSSAVRDACNAEGINFNNYFLEDVDGYAYYRLQNNKYKNYIDSKNIIDDNDYQILFYDDYDIYEKVTRRFLPSYGIYDNFRYGSYGFDSNQNIIFTYIGYIKITEFIDINEEYVNNIFYNNITSKNQFPDFTDQEEEEYKEDGYSEYTNDNNEISSEGFLFELGIYYYYISTIRLEDMSLSTSELEFNHYAPLPSSHCKNAEIQCNYYSESFDSPTYFYKDKKGHEETGDIEEYAEEGTNKYMAVEWFKYGPFINSDKIPDKFKANAINFKNRYSDIYYVDQNIVTLNSPDLIFDESFYNLDYSNPDLHLRIIGAIPIVNTISDISITTKTHSNFFAGLTTKADGFIKYNVFSKGKFGYRCLSTISSYFDEPNVYLPNTPYENYFKAIDDNESNNKWKPRNNDSMWTTSFVIYPWQRSGSLQNQADSSSDSRFNMRYSELKQKKMSNYRYSSYTKYFEDENDIKTYGNEKIYFYHDSEIKPIKIEDHYNNKKIYYANIDKIVSYNRNYIIDVLNKTYSTIEHDYLKENPKFTASDRNDVKGTEMYIYDRYDDVKFIAKLSASTRKETNDYRYEVNFNKLYKQDSLNIPYFPKTNKPIYSEVYNNDNGIVVDKNYNELQPLNQVTGYPIMTSGRLIRNIQLSMISNKYYYCYLSPMCIGRRDLYNPSELFSNDPISLKYKSTPHNVISLKTKDDKQMILPDLLNNGDDERINYINIVKLRPYWDTDNSITCDPTIIGLSSLYNSNETNYGWLWLGEITNDLYEKDENDNIIGKSQFGGVDKFGYARQEALLNNVWNIAGPSVKINENFDVDDGNTTIRFTEGDCYYMRWDCLKTYPFTLEDENSMTDFLSFYVESYINLDGRYDRNRGFANLVGLPSNTNLMNMVYSQKNNFFKYNILDSNLYNTDTYPNYITWTLTKTSGTETDTWTHVTATNVLDLDGDKGCVTSLNRLSNNIICFQEKAISLIMYNMNVALSVEQGTPIELANSGKVQGKQYVTEKIGCPNKWSIAETEAGIYFIDDYNKGIYSISGGFPVSLSDTQAMTSWIREQLFIDHVKQWNPLNYSNFKSFYNRIDKEVYFINKTNALAYSELMTAYTSFYSYEELTDYANLNKYSLMMKKKGNDTLLWVQHGGDFNKFFGTVKPYYIEVFANANPFINKTFDVIEFRADMYDDNNKLDAAEYPFTKLEAFNEYQYTEKNLILREGQSIMNRSNLKKKFRTWRVAIPRAKQIIGSKGLDGPFRQFKPNRDRMSNLWLDLKLINDNPKNYKFDLEDLMIRYFM